MMAVDDLVASIVATLRSNGEYESTTLVFLSDNGANQGSHRLGQKMAPYEESIRIPFAIAGPGIPHRTQTALVTQLDLTPTLLDLAGVTVPDTIDGRSYARSLKARAHGAKTSSSSPAASTGPTSSSTRSTTFGRCSRPDLKPMWVPTWRLCLPTSTYTSSGTAAPTTTTSCTT